MRKLIILAAACCMLALPGLAQQAGVPQRENVLTAYLDRANIHPPVQIGRLTFFPIVLSRASRLPRVLTMDQALTKKLLVISELDPAEVSRAKFTNKSKDKLIFLMAGEVLTGGKQNRTLATDALLGSASSAVLPLYCVQRGRWKGGGDLSKSATVAPQAVRSSAAAGAGQKAIWDEVARANRRLASKTESDDLAAAMNKPAHVKRLAGLRKRIIPRLPTGCVGVVVSRGPRIIAADLFNSAELFTAMRAKVLDSYLSEHTQAAGGASRVAVPDQNTVRTYLQACYKARFTAGETRGVGQVYKIRGARYGHALAYEVVLPGPIPATGPIIRPRRPQRRTRYMIHAALAERIVPVKPAPPGPPRPMPMPEPQPRRRPAE